ncbi:MAG TPA: CDP-diacylglycerol--glycerol-3-phosphate 3-phosphatidyltransferase [Smithella sp.]|nr:CDP-diacylglycerol--glycerol-3-phosphate 3-phosphatidyltransferase [Smithella sp.]MDM7985711.1 CDP-diacylglycerol--glycerol-3-phosphate 3-phosphatidyltransferase [Smithella sp.]HNY51654.1 CDP-diacylglycerol--glycerol-3-phosphate 3-phosphatidyltransferase [Smithella sp.]HOG91779.1 CDP-diacylglycerol--glycerol-3-phosphate 3-phosphatidyltransferase [Smithella sp.]HOU50501.1 CDP-diacylglycerol--glycerol-3-phosphate 3-phosphatidyltransferase [Smithella sp.]
MNIPNFLSLLRIILVPAIVIFLIQNEHVKALITFIVAGLTDALDGALARLLKKQTDLGAFLDPLADKILLSTSFIALSIFGLIPSWLTVIVISRDIIILMGIMTLSMMSISYEIKPVFVSKVTTALQIGTVFFALFLKSFTSEMIDYYQVVKIVSWLTASFTILSGLVYIYKGIKILNRQP